MPPRFFPALAALLIAPMLACAQPAGLSPAEQLYRGLAPLPMAERTKRLEEGARKEGAVTFIHTLRGELGEGHVNLFRKRYPYLKIEATTDIGSQDAAERLYAEETAGRHLTDAISVSLSDLVDVKARNFLARNPTPAIDALLPRMKKFIDPENRWALFFWSEHGISYNTDLVPPAQAPRGWMDLCNPFFKGSVSFDPLEQRYIAGLFAIMGEAQTTKLFECAGANDPIIQRGHSQRVELMLAGDHMVQGDNYLYHGLTIKRKNPSAPLGIVLSAPLIAGMGVSSINRNAAHPNAAALYVDWTLSAESQKYIFDNMRGPVTIKHPYLPDDIEIIDSIDPPKDVQDRLFAAWNKFVEKKR